jgi:hypothetical protein
VGNVEITHRGGAGLPLAHPTDGKGCPECGAIGNGGHGGLCPNQGLRYDESGRVIYSSSWDTPVAQIEQDLKDMQNP